MKNKKEAADSETQAVCHDLLMFGAPYDSVKEHLRPATASATQKKDVGESEHKLACNELRMFGAKESDIEKSAHETDKITHSSRPGRK